jgi:hypothetical protein
MCFGGGSNTKTEVYTPNSQVGKTGEQALQMGQTAAAQPFQQQVAPVAGFNADQQQAFQQYRDLQGYAQPYINQAAGLYGQSAQPITGDQVNNYLNPYANYVLGNMRDSAGQQMKQTTGSLTQAAGGVGADRIGVAQANLAKQQQLAEGQTLAGIYGNALGAAQQDQGRMQSAAQGLGGLGISGQQAQMAASQGLFGAGQTQQTQQQNELNAPYQWDLARIQHQYQMPQYLSQLTAQTAPSLGGTKTQTLPEQSPWGTIAGLGMTAAGAYMGNPQMMASGLKGATGSGGGMGNSQWSGWNPNVSGGWMANRGGRIPRAQGGRVTPLDVFRSFAGGGGAFADGGGVDSFEDRFSAVGDNPRISAAMEFGYPLPEEASTLPPQPQGPMAPALPPQIMGAQEEDEGMPPGAMGFAPQGQQPGPLPGPIPPQDQPPPPPSESALGLPPDPDEGSFSRSPWLALMQAGLGTMAAAGKRDQHGMPTNPFAAIGEGGMKGIETLKAQDTAKTQRRRVDLEAKRLLNQAEHQRATLGETRRYHDIVGGYRTDAASVAAQRAQETARHNREIELRAGDPSRLSPVQQAILAATKKKGEPLDDNEVMDIIQRAQRPTTASTRPPALAQQAIEAKEKELGRKLTAAELATLNAELRNGPTPSPSAGGDRPPSNILGDDDVAPNFAGATGLGGSVTAFGNKLTGALGAQAYPAEAKATRILNDLAIKTQSTMQNVAGRPSNYWLGRIGELTVEPNSWTEGPQSAEGRLKTTRNTIANEVRRIERDILSSPNTTKASRDKANRSLSELRNLLADYDAVLEAWGSGENPLTPIGEGLAGAAPRGGEVRERATEAAGALPKRNVIPPRPNNVPPGSKYSPSRKAWRTPDGQVIPHP